MPQLLNLTTIKQWIKDYRRNKYLPNETNSVTMDLDKIKEFISYIDEQNQEIESENQKSGLKKDSINAVRFYFTRQNNISDINVETDGTINDNLDHRNEKLEVRQRRMTVLYDKEFVPQSQISLLALPVLNYNPKERPDNSYTRQIIDFRQHREGPVESWWVGKDHKPNDDEVYCLYARGEKSEHTGLCPYNCDGTMDGES